MTGVRIVGIAGKTGLISERTVGTGVKAGMTGERMSGTVLRTDSTVGTTPMSGSLKEEKGQWTGSPEHLLTGGR